MCQFKVTSKLCLNPVLSVGKQHFIFGLLLFGAIKKFKHRWMIIHDERHKSSNKKPTDKTSKWPKRKAFDDNNAKTGKLIGFKYGLVTKLA